MAMMKRYAEEVSVELGFGGELNDQVLQEAQRRIDGDMKATGSATPSLRRRGHTNFDPGKQLRGVEEIE